MTFSKSIPQHGSGHDVISSVDVALVRYIMPANVYVHLISPRKVSALSFLPYCLIAAIAHLSLQYSFPIDALAHERMKVQLQHW